MITPEKLLPPDTYGIVAGVNGPNAMITDYESFLSVTEDGCIWWVLMDAVRLGAGFLPVRDDHT